MRALLFALGLSCIAFNAAHGFDDVVYTKDGSVLRGKLIEQDFENNRYKLQIKGGSVLAIATEDIRKITKEPAAQLPANDSPSEKAMPEPNTLTTQGKIHNVAPTKPATFNTVYFGRVYHETSEPYKDHFSNNDYTQYHNYRGLRAAYQHEHSEHIATLYALETAKLDTITIEDKDRNDTIYNLNIPESVRYLGVKSSIIASTNLNKGWQFYLGGGLFYDTYFQDSGNRNNAGILYDFGLGYSWYTCQAMLRFSGDLTNNQSNSKAESAEAVIDFGYNF
jgi:hypothetical protein